MVVFIGILGLKFIFGGFGLGEIKIGLDGVRCMDRVTYACPLFKLLLGQNIYLSSIIWFFFSTRRALVIISDNVRGWNIFTSDRIFSNRPFMKMTFMVSLEILSTVTRSSSNLLQYSYIDFVCQRANSSSSTECSSGGGNYSNNSCLNTSQLMNSWCF